MKSKETKVVESANQKHELAQAILSKECTIGIMGLGYVGLPLARAVVNQGYNCIGFDKNIKRIEKLNKILYPENYEDSEDTEDAEDNEGSLSS
jgi:UDP-N-acetyl-D-mannosaminuronate dehydrogenase